MKIKDRNITTWPNLGVNYWGVTKCANSTIKTHLWELEHNSKFAINKDTAIHSDIYVSRLTEYQALHSTNENFTVVRHPVSRFKSMYRDLVLSRVRVGKKASIEGFNIDQVLDYLETHSDSVRNVHLKSQSAFVNHDIKIIHLENLYNEWDFDFEPPAFKKNVTRNQDNIILTSYQTDRIYKIYQKDFIKFGYEK